MNLKMKIFQATTWDGIAALEEKINAWLETLPAATVVKDMTAALSPVTDEGGAEQSQSALITVWYAAFE
jgi:hypothetical protein